MRARLLWLLLPALSALLAWDSWTDYRALQAVLQGIDDQYMLKVASALRDSMAPAASGSFTVDKSAASVESVVSRFGPTGVDVHVGLTALPKPVNAPAPERTLLGITDMPAVPVTSAAANAEVEGAQRVWYAADYRGMPVRVLALRSHALDAQGRAFELLVQVARRTDPGSRSVRAQSLQSALIRDGRLVTLVFVLVCLGVHWSLGPLDRLRKSALQADQRRPALLALDHVPPDMAPLVNAVNSSVAGYHTLLDQQSRFLADASHQLRTPLAIMRTQAGVALREDDPALLRHTLHAMLDQITRSQRLCDQLLALAQASDTAVSEEAAEMVDLNAIARSVVLQHLSLAHGKDQDLGWVDATPAAQEDDAFRSHDAVETTAGTQAVVANRGAAIAVPVWGRALELHEALANLVHNAIVYTPAGGRITVQVSSCGKEALAEVLDSGPGIAPARRDTVFERFQRGTAAPEIGPHGIGLGLSIARAYARRNGGEIELTDFACAPSAEVQSTRLGLRAVLRMPLAIGDTAGR